jgi:hypothetical protein
MALTRTLFRAAWPLALLMVAAALHPARAEFFDDVKRTFQTDIPHFFQDDIPCAFGGQPTSGAKRSCKDDARPPAAATPHRTSERRAAPPRPRPPAPAPAPDQPETRTPREYP